MYFLPELSALPLISLAYAELHYHLSWLYPLYYRRQPEIIADLPHRLDLDKFDHLPLAIIIKDAHLFPVTLHKVTAVITDSSGLSVTQNFDLELMLTEKWLSRIIPLSIAKFEPEQELQIKIEFSISNKKNSYKVINDNFPGISHKTFITWIAKKTLLLPSGWYAGDPHYHSNFTSDQVEFGADIKITKTIAKAMGLSWFFVTDHSYDLDDKEDDFTKNDPRLPKWHKMRKHCSELDEPDFRVIPGEEISIGNNKGQNVHLLSINYHEFIEGHGDSAEVWGKNKPQRNLDEIPKLKSKDNFFAAAHPFENVPFIQKLTLRRGNWSSKDFQQSEINHLQLINSDEPKVIEKAVKTWTNQLLKGKKYFILAANDAHGNFNVMRQIKLPFISLWETRKQIFGNWMTIFQSDVNNPITALKSGHNIVSNGPFLSFTLKKLDRSWQFGDICPLRQASVEYQANTTPQFGEIDTIYCYRGNINTGKEFRFPVACPVVIALPQHGYIRMSLITKKGFMAFTNPIFTQHGTRSS